MLSLLSTKLLRSLFTFSLSMLLLVTSFSPTFAMCPPGFAPPGREYHPADNTRGLLVFAQGIERLILEPEFSGNATDFGLVLPLPSKPELAEAPEKIFSELEDLTNPVVHRPVGGPMIDTLELGSGIGVTVIEQRDVGDFTTTTLTADSTGALVSWLNENNYQYTDTDAANFDYYVEKGGYFFVAMKVNMGVARLDENGFLQGKLRPIEFAFTSERPLLPIRSMAGDMGVMNFTLYTLAAEPYYIPGVDIIYSKKVSFSDLEVAPSLVKYDGWGQWLARNEVRFDPRRIGQDLILERGNESMIVESTAQVKRFNPHLLPLNSGIIEGTKGQLKYIDTPKTKPKTEAGVPLRSLGRLVLVLITFGGGWWLWQLLTARDRSKSTMSQVAQKLKAAASGHDHSLLVYHPRNVMAGLLSALGLLVLAYVVGEQFGRFGAMSAIISDTFSFFLTMILLGLVILLIAVGPAVYVAARSGWRAFIAIALDEIFFIGLYLLLTVYLPVWDLVPYLF